MPRTRPPYPATNGLFGKPTLVQNVETLAQVPLIIRKGPEWYRKIGTPGSCGTKLFSLSGRINRLGVVEVPFGTPLEKLVNGFGGGVRSGEPLKALLLGGPSGKFVAGAQLSTPIDFERFEQENLVMGSGSLVVLDDGCCPINLMKNLMDFNHQESCGKCIPCRDGTKRIMGILESVTTRPATQEKYDALERFRGITCIEGLAEVMQSTSLCGLGKTAANPVISGMKLFREEMEEHVFDRTCRAGVCRNLRSFRIDPVNCTGCNICLVKCPENAIIGSPHRVHIILDELCSGCGKCYEVCKFNAVRVT
jgi:NADH:ubiquinone oxidoreductase subunit F (NADH-binding)/ferredoxin